MLRISIAKAREGEIIKNIEHNLSILKQMTDAPQPHSLDSKWTERMLKEPRRFINPDLTLIKESIKNFRKELIFITDEPSFNPSLLNIKNIIGGGRRSSKRLLLDCLDLLKKHNYLDLLKRYPCASVGNPYVFRWQGYAYTYRWARHIYYIGLFKKTLESAFKKDFIALDIGSSYGIFSYLLKHEFKNAHSLLLDFPEQLVLAHYFLALSFPHASIAGFKEVIEAPSLDRAFFEKYDFVLVPWFLYKNIISKSIDVITNFASFGEMKRDWFSFYFENEPFKSAPYFYTINRFQSAPTYNTDITILDYPLKEFKVLHFAISPSSTHTYQRRCLFFYEKVPFSSQFFEFIGEKTRAI